VNPTLLNSCAAASTSAEARFRISGAPRLPRSTRVVSLDNGAAQIVGDLADLELESAGGSTLLSAELDDADFLMMVATDDAGASAATAIGNACTLRGIMTAALVVGGGPDAVSALRPHARVLLVSDDRLDVDAVLGAVGS
jgi:hypothetical protein